jgi:ketosteroid isomerase-like protein
MSRDDVKRGRTMEQRLGVRWPGLAQRMTAGAMRLRVGSRLRRALLNRAARAGFEAWSRGDLDAATFLDDPEIETHIEQTEGIPVGFDEVYHGVEGHSRVMEIWNEAWKTWRGDVADVIEVGKDGVLAYSHQFGEGYASGVELEMWGAGLYLFRRGKLVHLRARWDVNRDRLLETFSAELAAAAPNQQTVRSGSSSSQ